MGSYRHTLVQDGDLLEGVHVTFRDDALDHAGGARELAAAVDLHTGTDGCRTMTCHDDVA